MVVIEEIDDTPPAPSSEILKILENAQKNQPKFIEITPEACYVLKLKTTQDQKIFINICSHEKVPSPKPKSEKEMLAIMETVFTEQGNSSDDNNPLIDYRVPVSIGEKHIESDKSGNLVTCYDCVFHPDFNKICLTSNSHFQFQIHLIFQSIAAKYGHEFKETWVKLKNKKYFGEKILATNIADRGNKANIETVATGTSKTTEISERKSASAKATTQATATPANKKPDFFYLPPNNKYKITKKSNSEIEIAFQNTSKYKNLDLQVGAERVLLKDGSKILADIWLPVKMKNLSQNCSAEYKNKNLNIF